MRGQEQGLHEVQRQLREEMASKVRGGSSPLRKNGTFGAWCPEAASSGGCLRLAFPWGCSVPSRSRWLRECVCLQLDRLELGPFQQQLDEHWKSSLEQLKEMAPPVEADDAAGIRK